MDNSLLKSDIFFFVATIGFIILGLLVAVGLIYILAILKLIKHISQQAKTGTDAVVESIEASRDEIKKNGFAPSVIAKIFKTFYNKRKK